MLGLAALSLAATASPAGASVTVGQLAPGSSPDTNCSPNRDNLMPTVSSGTPYVVPGNGVITTWSHNAAAGGGQTLSFKVFRHLGGAEFTPVAHNGPRSLAGGSLNTFPVNIPVSAGDIIGLNTGTAGGPSVACEFDGPDQYFSYFGDLPDGQSAPFNQSLFFYRLNISAVFEPSNAATVGKTALNKKKGTATLTIDVPNPGELTASGNGVKAAAAGATISKAVTSGAAQLLIKAKGKKKRKLNETGKVKLKVAVTYTPTGGDPATQTTKVKLKKKR